MEGSLFFLCFQNDVNRRGKYTMSSEAEAIPVINGIVKVWNFRKSRYRLKRSI